MPGGPIQLFHTKDAKPEEYAGTGERKDSVYGPRRQNRKGRPRLAVTSIARFALVAQSVERYAENVEVSGSIPGEGIGDDAQVGAAAATPEEAVVVWG